MHKQMPEWEKYERLVARLMADQLSTAYCVTPNAKIEGKISGRKRQIDVLIDCRHGADPSTRLIVDAKARSRRIDVVHVEAFRGLMVDVGATHGYLVCPHGYTKAAERRAQDAVSIRLLPLDRLDDFDPSKWPRCLHASCRNGRVFWDGYPAIDLKLASANGGNNEIINLTYVHYVGKCDRCSRFHVRCLTCGDLFSPAHDHQDDYGVQCGCRMPWFWLASVESDGNGRRAAELHLVKVDGQVITVNRRSY